MIKGFGGDEVNLGLTGNKEEESNKEWNGHIPPLGLRGGRGRYSSQSRSNLKYVLMVFLLLFMLVHLGFAVMVETTAEAAGFNPNVNGAVYSTTVQPDGRLVIGGSFTIVEGAARNNIARLNADGTLDSSFNPNTDGAVRSIALQSDGKIIVGGEYTIVGGAARNNIARLTADGTLDSSFNPNANNWVHSIKMQTDGKILIGGAFTTVGGLTRNRIARLNTNGTPDSSFNSSGTNNAVETIDIQQADGKIVIGGQFTQAGGGSGYNYIARLNTDGIPDASFLPNLNHSAWSVTVLSDGQILMGGTFTTVGGASKSKAAKLYSNGTINNDFVDPIISNNTVYALAVQTDGKILIGGNFIAVGGVTRNRIARLNPDGTLDSSFNPDANGEVYSVQLQADGKILLGGAFTAVAGVAQGYIARLNVDGTLDYFSTISINEGTNGSITCDVNPVPMNNSSTCNITPNLNYHVTDVTIDGSSLGAITQYTFHNVTTAHSISATFQGDSQILNVNKAGTGAGTISSSPVGIDCSVDCAANFDYNTTVTLTAKPSTGSTFTGWTGDADCSDGHVTMLGEVKCTATFTLIPYSVTTMAGGVGGTVSTGGMYDYGSVITLSANPSSGYVFDHWSNGCTGANPSIQVTVSGEITCQANFSLATLVDGLIAYYPFNGNANDESGYGHNGSVNGATITTDRLAGQNSAYNFNGSSSKISAAAGPEMSVSQVTLSAWINITGYGGYGTDNIVAVEPPGTSSTYYALNLSDTSSPRNVQFYVTVPGVAAYSVMTTTTFNNSAGWHHIAATFDGSTVKVYVDGVLDNTEAFPHALRAFSSAVIAIGYDDNNTGQFHGALDDIRIYSRALAPSEVHQLYNGAAVDLPRTGQTKCYNASGTEIGCTGTGQDGERQAGLPWPTPRFTNPDGSTPVSGNIVLDKLTGLEWAKDGSTPTVSGAPTCTGGTKTWTAALDYVACLNTNNYLGHNDWHLPNINELESLINASLADSAAWLNNQGFNSVQLSSYISSTTMAFDHSSALFVNMLSGSGPGFVGKSIQFGYVLPVRSSQSGTVSLPRTGQTSTYYANDDGALQKGIVWPATRFTVIGGSIVEDALTALQWTIDANAPGPLSCSPAVLKTWQASLDYVACLNNVNYLGFSDWRLPNIYELRSLADYEQVPPAVQAGHPFLNLPTNTSVMWWSSTTSDYLGGDAWAIDMGSGGMSIGYHKSNLYSAWPVRGGVDKTLPITAAQPAGGTYGTPVDVVLTTNEPATIYYTTDGSTPTEASNVYLVPIKIAANATLKYISKDASGNIEAPKSQDYTINTCDTNSGQFILTGDTGTGRIWFSSTLLSNGKVLIAGGCNSLMTQFYSSAEVYDPATGSFAPTGNMSSARQAPAATLLPNGKVLLTGGSDGPWSGVVSAELYDPSSEAFILIGNMNSKRYNHTSTLLPDGRVLLTGGSDGTSVLDSAEVYDPGLGSFTLTGSMTFARASHAASLLPDGTVLITGGGNSVYLNSAEIYDPQTGVFTQTGDMINARVEHTSTTLSDGTVLIAGGSGPAYAGIAELYNPVSGLFSSAGVITPPRSGNTASLLDSGRVLITGGSGETGYLNAPLLYNSATGLFSSADNMSSARYLHSATVLHDGRVLITGGASALGIHPIAAELYNPTGCNGATSALTLTTPGTGSGTVTSTYSSVNWSNGTGSSTYPSGQIITLTATPAEGSLFVSWTGDCSGTNPVIQVTMSGPMNCQANFRPLTLTDGLVAFYPFNGNANDESGNGNNGTAYNGASLVADRFGNPNSAYTFDGVDDYVQVPHADILNPDSLTISSWVKFNATKFGAANLIVDKAQWASNCGYYTAYSNGDGLFMAINDDQYRHGIDIGLNPDQLGWLHLVTTYNSTTGVTELFLNGISQGKKTGAPVLCKSTEPLNIGKTNNNDNFTNAFIDDIRIYSRVLTSSEVHQLYNGAAIDLPRTGQTKCYNAAGTEIDCTGTGQDGERQAGLPWPTPRCTNPDGSTPVSGNIVLDKLTGLEWAKDGSTPTVSGAPTCTGGTKTWTAALDYVACLNTNNYLGHNDWHLPNINELESLTDAGMSNPALSGTSPFTAVQIANYWSSTTGAINGSDAWYVGMANGKLTTDPRTYSYYVWPVRSGQSGVVSIPRTGQTTSYYAGDDGALQLGAIWPGTRFNDNGDSTVTDGLTGLIWTKNANAPGPTFCTPGVAKTWQAGMDYVSCLNTNNYLGFSDWRLPNKKELRSLADYKGYNPSYPVGHLFLNAKSSDYWSSSTGEASPSSAWNVNFVNGGMDINAKSNSFYIWPVRGGVDKTLPITAAQPAGGTYGAPVEVVLTTNEPATIYYTTDGSTPSEASNVYVVPIRIAANGTLKYFAKDSSGNTDSVQSQSYVFNICNATSGQFVATGSMGAARAQHLSVRLPNGKVLVAGGGNAPGNELSTAELYDPITGLFSPTGSLNSGRVNSNYSTISLLPNGKVLVAGGGAGGGYINAPELYDPSTGIFSVIGNMSAQRGMHSQTLLSNGKVLLAGGGNMASGYLNTAELYDYATGTFSAAADMTSHRGDHAATLLDNGKVLISGGWSGSSHLASAELYDSGTNTFATTGSMTNARNYHRAVPLSNGLVLIVGGGNSGGLVSQAELYNPGTGLFTTTGSLLNGRSNPVAVLLPTGKVLISGGSGSAGESIKTAEVYDPNTGQFSATGDLNSLRAWHAGVLLANGKVLVSGGNVWGGTTYSTAELYTPTGCSGQSFLLTVNLTGTGTGTVTLSSGSLGWNLKSGTATFPDGDVVTLYATPSTNSYFNGWTDCPNPNGTQCTVSMTQARTVYASFMPADFTLNAASSLNVVQGKSTQTTVTLTAIQGFSALTTLSYSFVGGTPANTTVSINPASLLPLQGGAVSTLTISAGAGTPAGTYTLRVTAGGGGLTKTSDIQLTVRQPLNALSATLASGILGQAYNQYVGISGGIPPYTVTKTTGALPDGLTLNPDGSITGFPSARGTFTFGIQVTDAGANVAAAQISIRIYDLSYRKLVLDSISWQVAANSDSEVINARLIDDYDQSAAVQNATPISISSSSATGRFTTDQVTYSGSSSLQISISAGSSSVGFRLRDSAAGNETLTAQGNGFVTASHDMTVTAPTQKATSLTAVTSTNPTFGGSVRISGYLKDISVQPAVGLWGATVYLKLTAPSGAVSSEKPLEVGPSGDYQFTMPASLAGNWTATLRFAGDEQYASASTTLPFTVARAATSLLANKTIRVDESVDVSGKLSTTLNYDLFDLEIMIRVTDPLGAATIVSPSVYTSDVDGRFLRNLKVFNRIGTWKVEVQFMGSDNLAPSLLQTLLVEVSGAGYAILIQGYKKPGNGYEEDDAHRSRLAYSKSLDDIRQKLLDKGIPDEDIYYLNYDGPPVGNHPGADSTVYKAQIEYAITTWAADKLSKLAPLYIVMVDHGSMTGGYRFHVDLGDNPLDEQNITPEELSGWINTLEGNVGSSFPLIIVNGMCYSGGFIDALSKQGRVIVTSSSSNEASIQGGGGFGEVFGEKFVYHFFEYLTQGSNLLNAFSSAAEHIYGAWMNGSGNNHHGHNARILQHPLLDDNGDHSGSWSDQVAAEQGRDGYYAAQITLGRTLNSSFVEWDLSSTGMSQVLTVDPGQSASLFAKTVPFGNTVSAWIDIKKPSYVMPDLSSGPLPLNLPQVAGSSDGSRFNFALDTALLNEPGLYTVYYNAMDTNGEALSPVMRYFYVDSSTNVSAPNNFNLILPEDGGNETSNLVQFIWEDAVDPDGDAVTYTLKIFGADGSGNIDRSKELRRYELLPRSTHYVRSSERAADGSYLLSSGQIYWWEVEAWDIRGKHTASTSRSFQYLFLNQLALLVNGTVTESGSSTGIVGAQISGDLGGLTYSLAATPSLQDPAGSYLLGIPSDSSSLVVSKDGYQTTTVQLNRMSNDGIVYQNIVLVPIIQQKTLTLLTGGTGRGKVSGSGKYNQGTAVAVSATAEPDSVFSAWTGHCASLGQSGTIVLDTDKSCTAVFTLKQYSLTLSKTGNGTVSGTPGITGTGVFTFGHGSVVQLSAVADPQSSVFTGWSGSCSGFGATQTIQLTMDSAKSCSAVFTLRQFNLNITKNGTGNGTVTGTGLTTNGTLVQGLYNYGTPVVVTATPAPGTLFAGWSGPDCNSTSSPITIFMSRTKSCVATFNLDQNMLTVQRAGNGTGSVTSGDGRIHCDSGPSSDCTELYTSNAVSVLTAHPDAEMTFAGWSNCPQRSGSVCTVSMLTPRTVVATFNDHPVRKEGGGYFKSLLDILNNDTSLADMDVVQSMRGTYDFGYFIFKKGFTIVLRGGYDDGFTNNLNMYTSILGSFTIEDGAVVFEGISIE